MLSFVIDEQLSPLLARWLVELGHDAVHVRDAGLASATDLEIAAFAAERGAVLVSKDADFVSLRQAGRLPCPLLWLRLGNRSTAGLQAVLAPRIAAIAEIFAEGGDFCEISGEFRIVGQDGA